MLPELQRTLEGFPSYFKSNFTPEGDRVYSHEGSLIGIGCSLEELVVAEYEVGNAVVADVLAGKIGHKETLKIQKTDRLHPDFEILNFQEDGLYVWEADACHLKRGLLGDQSVSDEDIVYFYQTQTKAFEGLPILGFGQGISTGDFIENYMFGEPFTRISRNDDYFSYIKGTELALLDIETYFEIERIMRKNGFLDEETLITPVIHFSESDARIIIEKEGPSEYFSNFWKFERVDEESKGIFEIKEAEYKE